MHHILNGRQTIQSDEGLFLEETWRLHPMICSYTSELFYEGKLHALKGLDVQAIESTGRFAGSGMRYVAVDHFGNQSSSLEEAEVIEAIVKDLLG